MVVDSLVSGGCIISGAHARRSVLFSKVRLHSYSTVEEAVLLPEVDVGRHCRLRKVVIDKGCQIPEACRSASMRPKMPAAFSAREQGVVLVTREMLERLAAEKAPGEAGA